MKHHHLRQAQQILTLSLLGSLALLAACGGGKGGGGAPAAPAAVEAPEPTVETLADPNEPYLMSESASELEGTVFKYKLNVIDGIAQTLTKSIDFGGPTKGLWATVNEIERKPVAGDTFLTTDTDKGPSKLYYVLPNFSVQKDSSGQTILDSVTGKPVYDVSGGNVFQLDISRTNDPTPMKDRTPKQISSINNACSITSTYNITQNGKQSALLVTIPGSSADNPNPAGLCGDPASTDASQQALVALRQTVVVKTDDPTTGPTRPALSAAEYQPLAYLYEDGSLTGILSQHKIDQTTAQLDVLSPTQDTVLVSGVPITNGLKAPFTTYTIDKDRPEEVGVQWITRKPRSYSNGYMRIQGTELDSKGKITSFNRFYEFAWTSGATPSASLTFIPSRALLDGVKSNIGITDDKNNLIYFVNGRDLVFGPIPDTETDVPFQVKAHNFTPEGLPPMKATKLYQTDTSVVAVVQDASNAIGAYTINKSDGYNLILAAPSPNRRVLGIQNGSLFYINPHPVYLNVSSLFAVPFVLHTGQTFTDGRSVPYMESTIVQTVLTDNALSYGDKNPSRLVFCSASLANTSCVNTSLKVFDLASQTITKELGELTFNDTYNIVADTPDQLVGNTDVFRIQKVLNGGFSATIPYVFHSGAKGSLKAINTFVKATTPAPSASSVAN